MVNNKHFSGK